MATARDITSNAAGTVVVESTERFAAWFAELSQDERATVVPSVDALRRIGVHLGFPASSAIKGVSRVRELRCGALRVFYVFDSERQAVLLVGGEKADKKLYDAKKGVVAQALKEFAAWEEKLEAARKKRAEDEKKKSKK